ncbi:formimidoylglutamase [Sphingobacterium sp. HJSM2_6]|uniref:formimidoylglutamase n=1 Tax=Sphingobacterium sp. HJSM2_6 TaxID=3366264 RepID=UPI003BE10E3D
MHRDQETCYEPVDINLWQGRIDGDETDYQRWHQVIGVHDIRKNPDMQGAAVFLGFCCDEGVRRNQGRTGAKAGPDHLRRVLAGLPVHFSPTLRLMDIGNISCHEEEMEAAQGMLSQCVEYLIKVHAFPIVLGGGHEITYGHFKGIRNAKAGKIGIINIDAHLDIRQTEHQQGNSGTSFYQIAEEAALNNEEFHYLAIGIQDISNTKALFNYAAAKSVAMIKREDIYADKLPALINQILAFAQSVDHIYLTIDLDAFSAAHAPGVSAISFNGIIPDHSFHRLFSTLLQLPNLISVDIAEYNPRFDIDHRTAKLAADLIFQIVQKR